MQKLCIWINRINNWQAIEKLAQQKIGSLSNKIDNSQFNWSREKKEQKILIISMKEWCSLENNWYEKHSKEKLWKLFCQQIWSFRWNKLLENCKLLIQDVIEN